MKDGQIKNNYFLGGFFNFVSENIGVISITIGASLAIFGFYKFYKSFNYITSDFDLLSSFDTKYSYLGDLAFVSLENFHLTSLLNDNLFYSFCLNFFKNYSNLNIFLDNLSMSIEYKKSLMNFIYFCINNPSFDEFRSYSIDKKIILEFLKELYNHIRVLKNLSKVFYS